MELAAKQSQPDAILHLGDHIADAQELRQKLPGTAFHMVRGNCDFQAGGPDSLLLTFGGVKIFMTHGHLYGVKNGTDALIAYARTQNADLALYGHTHIAQVKDAGGLWLMNPGQTERHGKARAASYGVVTIENGALACDIVRLAE
jgi:putative phosphoesterase